MCVCPYQCLKPDLHLRDYVLSSFFLSNVTFCLVLKDEDEDEDGQDDENEDEDQDKKSDKS